VSRARLDRLHPITEENVDLTRIAHVAGVPRFMLGDMVRLAGTWFAAAVRTSSAERISAELLFAYHLGYVRECRRAPAPGDMGPAAVGATTT
jgi:hypothetical protein